jgi:hypothetical protein
MIAESASAGACSLQRETPIKYIQVPEFVQDSLLVQFLRDDAHIAKYEPSGVRPAGLPSAGPHSFGRANNHVCVFS